MRLIINVEKRFAYAIVSALLILAGIFAVAAYNSNPAIPSTFGHSTNEIAPGTFSGDASSLFVFPGSVAVTENVTAKELKAAQGITLGGIRKTSWPTSLGCSWSGLKCACGADNQGSTQVYSVSGIECANGIVSDYKYVAFHAGANAACPVTANATWSCTGGYTANNF